MRRAVELAQRSGRETRPNPPVGCVLVRDGAVVGEGFHRRAGLPHAEIEALSSAGADAAGATAYVTLEPCNHHGRTGPCSEALIAAGVARVVVGCADPNPAAAGGADRLRAAGIVTAEGVLQTDCERVAEVFFANVRYGRPHFRLKLAATLDGRTAATDGTSQWITGLPSRVAVHELRRAADAVLVGSGTVLADDPTLSVRHVPTQWQPARVVLDRRLRVSTAAKITCTIDQPTYLCTTAQQLRSAEERFSGTGVTVVGVGDGGPGWLAAVARELLALGMHAVLCEPGQTAAAALLHDGLVDRIDVMVGGKLLGAGAGVLHGLGIETIADAMDVEIDLVRPLGGDAWLSGRIRRGE
jgi:diaminohydroxyphosphoribosylaminopyrimidine deaminase / 5-amino-6-(5-phosphoribosylamino)uracil reductase